MCDSSNNKLRDHESPLDVLADKGGDNQVCDFPQQNMQPNMINGLDAFFGDGGPGPSQIMPWNFPHPFGQAYFPAREPDPFLPSTGLFSPRRPSGLQLGYELGRGTDSHQHLRLITESLVQTGPAAPFGLHAELQKMTAQEIMDAKALAASKSHSEAERRRRERINNHMAKLRSLLPSTTKTDKASLLAEVIHHVKELKQQTSLIAETSPVPSETNELTVDTVFDEEGRALIRASICCDDRHELVSDLINALKALRLKTLKAEITTLGGRVKNVLFMSEELPNVAEEGGDQPQPLSVSSIEEALKAVMERVGGDEPGSGGLKRQRANGVNMLEHTSL